MSSYNQRGALTQIFRALPKDRALRRSTGVRRLKLARSEDGGLVMDGVVEEPPQKGKPIRDSIPVFTTG